MKPSEQTRIYYNPLFYALVKGIHPGNAHYIAHYEDGGTSRLRLGGCFAGGNGLSVNLEGARENAADGASHIVLLRGEVAF